MPDARFTSPDIEKYADYTLGHTDILRVAYDRKIRFTATVSRRCKFPRTSKSVVVDSGTQ